jgi:hypothetical protein
VFENRVLRIFGLNREEMTGGRKNLHNEDCIYGFDGKTGM